MALLLTKKSECHTKISIIENHEVNSVMLQHRQQSRKKQQIQVLWIKALYVVRSTKCGGVCVASTYQNHHERSISTIVDAV